MLGVIATPALDEVAVEGLMRDLEEALAERYPDVRWDLTYVTDPLVSSPAHLTELIGATRERMLAEDWDLALAVTELPLRLRRRPVLTHASPTHGAALISLPALGMLDRGRRLREAAMYAIGALVGDERRGCGRRRGHLRARQALVQLATDVDDPEGQPSMAFLARVIGGNVRLLLGMIRANRPWRLISRLTRALVGALAVASFTLIASDLWRISASLHTLRLVVLAAAAIATAVVALIAAHNLWEPARDSRAREQTILFNIATLATLTLGMAWLYTVGFVVILAVAAVLVEPSLFARSIGHPVNVSDYLRLAWLASSLATVGGALGAALESDDAVREATYGVGRRDD
jgi:hypothetical protein